MATVTAAHTTGAVTALTPGVLGRIIRRREDRTRAATAVGTSIPLTRRTDQKAAEPGSAIPRSMLRVPAEICYYYLCTYYVDGSCRIERDTGRRLLGRRSRSAGRMLILIQPVPSPASTTRCSTPETSSLPAWWLRLEAGRREDNCSNSAISRRRSWT